MKNKYIQYLDKQANGLKIELNDFITFIIAYNAY